ncbi:MAG TPA: AMP-binding protein [Candidatus Thermoplasmatota archaeon]|nr:AMP-binding protein [Candidatus Thermoplasmatota archaeon]
MADPAGIVWRPTPEIAAEANVARFMRRVGAKRYEDLLARSQGDVAWFWGEVERDLGFDWYEPYKDVVDESAGVMWAKWFVGGRTNIALNCVDRHATGPRRNKLAIVWEGENGEVRKLSYRDLSVLVDGLANVLRARGIGKGDAVGVYMPMIPEAAAALLAIAKVGGIFVPLFSGFGADAIEKRLKDADAKALVTADGFLRRGDPVLMKEIADEAVNRVPSVATVVVHRRLGELAAVPWHDERDVDWAEAVASAGTLRATEPMDAEDPWMVIYTSGTTGRPKGSVHVHGGFMVKVAQEVAHQVDLREDDILFWFTDMGWIMGPWEIVGGLALGGTVLLYEGSPDWPAPDRLWSLVERHGVTILGISPTLIRSLMKHGDEPPREHDLSSLRILASTGEPWNPEPWLWTFREIGGERCPIINLSGGTEVGACFLSPTPLTPLRPTSLGHPALGMAVDVVDDAGNPVPRGTVGELVAKRPWPGMTRGLWKDPERFIETYWSRWPGLWYHGDFASIDAEGNWYLHGRSDDTIKIAGKRVGPAEVESILVDTGLVVEAAAIGVPDPVKGESVHAYVILKPGVSATPEVEAKLAKAVAEALGKPFRPAGIHPVRDLPRTRNAKILRRAVRARATGREAGDLTALANPQALDEIRRVTEG